MRVHVTTKRLGKMDQRQTTVDDAPDTTDPAELMTWGREFVQNLNRLDPEESLELVDVEVSMTQPAPPTRRRERTLVEDISEE
jgi:hypothetical protein